MQAPSWNGALIWAASLSVLIFIVSIALVWALVVWMPANYLVRERLSENGWFSRHPVSRLILVIIKNALGLALVVLGLIMLLTPGQGLLSLFLGVTLLDFPGKRRLMQRMLGRRGVLKVINRIRQNANRPPLEIP